MTNSFNRETEYVRGYGYVTGDGILDTITEGIKTLVTSKAVRDAGSEALKAAAKSGGDKLGTKIVERAFKEKRQSNGEEKTKEKERQSKEILLDQTKPITETKTTSKQNRDILKEIYADSLFKKQRGRGLNRI